jgi:hypothetical protein
MLVENKFIYISLPRTASTSFYYTCLINGLNVNHVNQLYYENNLKVDFNKIDTDKIMNFIEHGHETLYNLKNKFGHNYPIIAVNRDKYDRFISLYKHILFDFKRVGLDHLYEYFSKLSSSELFFYKSNEILNKELRWKLINEYLINKKLVKEPVSIHFPKYQNMKVEDDFIKGMRWYINNILDLLITPTSYWHMYDEDILWFDFQNLSEMENWVSEKLNKKFVMKKLNSSKHIECNLKLDNKFIELYDSVYNFYESPKKNLTLI